MPDPGAPLSFRLDEIGDIAFERLAAILDILDDIPGIRRLRQWARDALRVQPGEHTLDIGSGTGAETRQLATAVTAKGSAIGIDPNPAMAALAWSRAAEEESTARFVVGDVYSLPFPDCSVDAVRCERVFEHLTDPAAAMAEITRVLRPSGRAMIIDTDWGTAIAHPGDPAVLAKVTEAMLGATPNPHSGRLLAGQLAAAGLSVRDIGSQALIQTPATSTEPMLSEPFPQLMMEAAGIDGVITADELAVLVRDLEAGVERGDFHMSVTMFAYLARKD
ncbi:methyltransferase [Rhodococcus sp. WMMA185]|uniref:methyltransferase domain-containing protein n=1 Tax=Rhodococcus sp. WMMA185 TaxID=679318 RepID=UPI0008783CB6|nr:methyltransferase domain-containing protein [Rhodococcus sp. WMMA185]AOW93727.1 methyltransferase [Rhodococcus sp. WMMA185]